MNSNPDDFMANTTFYQMELAVKAGGNVELTNHIYIRSAELIMHGALLPRLLHTVM